MRKLLSLVFVLLSIASYGQYSLRESGGVFQYKPGISGTWTSLVGLTTFNTQMATKPSTSAVAQQIADSLNANTIYYGPGFDGVGTLLDPVTYSGSGGIADSTIIQGSTNPIQGRAVYPLSTSITALNTTKANLTSPAFTNATGNTVAIADGSSALATGDAVYDAIAALSGGAIADGSVTNAKLATDVKIGSLTSLSTTAKATLVEALNELYLLNNPDFRRFPTLLGETEYTGLATSSLNPTSGSVYRQYVTMPKSGTITRIGVRIFTAGATLVNDQTQNGCAVYDPSGNRLGIVSGVTAFTTTGDKYLTTDVPIVVTAGTTYGVVCTSTGTTAAVFYAALAAPMINFNQSAPPYTTERISSATLSTTLPLTGGTIINASTTSRILVLLMQ